MNNENPNDVLNIVNPLGDSNDQPKLEPISDVSSDTPVADANSAPVTKVETTNETPEVVPQESFNIVSNDAKPEVPVTPQMSESAANIKPNVGDVRYNPVTGEEVNVGEMVGTSASDNNDEVNNVEKLKKVEIEYKPTSTANTVMLVLFFLFLVLFIVFLPDLQNLIALYKAGGEAVPEEITTGVLVCTIESSSSNLDTEIERRFSYIDKKLTGAKFITTVRGDPTLDEEELDNLNNVCTQIKNNVSGLSGISVNCEYEEGKLVERESFDYSSYNSDEVTSAYVEAGGSVLELEKDDDIDEVMTKMRRSGFTCNKEKE